MDVEPEAALSDQRSDGEAGQSGKPSCFMTSSFQERHAPPRPAAAASGEPPGGVQQNVLFSVQNSLEQLDQEEQITQPKFVLRLERGGTQSSILQQWSGCSHQGQDDHIETLQPRSVVLVGFKKES